MTNRLARSLPFWVLALLSLASVGFGLWLVLSKTSEMSASLADETATYEQVYVSPTWVGFGGVLVGAGIVGLLLVLTLAALRDALPTPAVAEDVVIDAVVPVEDQAVEVPAATAPAPAEITEASVPASEGPASTEGSEGPEAPGETPAR